MNKLLLFLLIMFEQIYFLNAQTVTGKVVNQNGKGLAGLQVQLYSKLNIFSTTSDSSGSFTFTNITDVKNVNLPYDYIISNNYPNPFNPKTRINFTLPKASKVKIELFNTIGQRVSDLIEKEFGSGNSFIDLELTGLANGVYLAKINIDDKYSVVKKLMLLYGSQHLIIKNTNWNTALTKSILFSQIDSITVYINSTFKYTFKNFPLINESSFDAVNLIVDPFYRTPCPRIPTVTYSGKIYNTIQIGDQCWLKENLNVGIKIHQSENQTNNGVIEKFCFGNDIANCEAYGGLYQWSEAMQYNTEEKAIGICPEGWHVPSYSEFQTLASAVANDGNKLKREDQGTGSNESGFSALMAGLRDERGFILAVGAGTHFWTSTSTGTYNQSLHMSSYYADIDYVAVYYFDNVGFSVRCIKDGLPLDTTPSIPMLLLPSDGVKNQSITPTIFWTGSVGATSYTLQVSTNSSFTNLFFDQNVGNATSKQISFLKYNTIYYWRVNASNSFGTSNWSNRWSFRTVAGGTTAISCPGVPTLPYLGKIYNTVQIGNQCWLKENLDVGAIIDGKVNQTDDGTVQKYCYNNNPANCDAYGGLYQWSEAMQYNTEEKAMGICPEGWHIPSYSEFQTLASSVANDGNKLKREDQGENFSKGTNESGFSAMLTGTRNSGAGFDYLNYITSLWSSTKDAANVPSILSIGRDDTGIYLGYDDLRNGYSVRCIKDEQPRDTVPTIPMLLLPSDKATNQSTTPILSWTTSFAATSYTLQVSTDHSSTNLFVNQNVGNVTSKQVSYLAINTIYYWRVNASNSFGTSNWSTNWSFKTGTTAIPCPGVPTVTYSGKTYNTVQIGNQCWLKENLDVGVAIDGKVNQTDNGIVEKYCYNNNPANCVTYGGLYQWNEAMQYNTEEKAMGICPEGWHVPSYSELQTLASAIDNDGNKLKRQDQGEGFGKGTNESGFSALLTGIWDYQSNFVNLSISTFFWSSSQNETSNAFDFYLDRGNGSISFQYAYKAYGFSIRCVKD